jgi:uncharacterized protein YegJ (DUF2314 family)
MDEMDLIPSDYRKERNRHNWIRKFLTLCVLVVIAIASLRGMLGYLIWRENVQVVRLEQQESIAAQNNAKAETYRQQKQVTERQLAALNELRGRDRVAQFLQSIDTAYSPGIWFDSIHFMRENKTGTLQNVPSNTSIIVVPNGAEDKPLDISQSVEIVGHASNHTILAEFMRKLGAQPNVADLRLIDTTLRSYAAAQIVDFNMTLQIAKKSVTPP